MKCGLEMTGMTGDIFRALSYGMYAIGVKGEDGVSACIANTVVQVSNAPDIIAVSINRSSFSHECIVKTGIFTVSVLSEDTSGAVIGALGFNSGRRINKLKNITHRVLAEGVPVVRENICCWFLCLVVGRTEAGAYTVFLAEVVAGSESVKGRPMTYEYYRHVIKGRAPEASPTYPEEKVPADETGDGNWICPVCGYVFNDPVVPFEELPEDWICPVCGAPKNVFRRQKS